MTLTLAPLRDSDLTAAVAVARSVGWNDSEADWRVLAACGRLFGHRDNQGQLVSTGARCDFGEVVTLAKMIVRAEQRGRGLASQLIEHCLETRSRPSLVTLVATALGRPVYARAGFCTVAEVSVLFGLLRGRAGAAQTPVVALGDSDWATALRFDATVMGCDRGVMLTARRALARSAVCARRPDGSLGGFALAVTQGDRCLIGPVLADNLATALDLIDAAVADWQGLVRIELPATQRAAIARLAHVGLLVSESREEMTLAGAPLPGRRDLRFALAALAFG
jgi:predicted GNAT family N-acyltransferase